MFYVDSNYLKNVGLFYDEKKNFMRIRKNSYKFPTLSCKLNNNEIIDNKVENNFILVLSYFVSDDFAKQQIEFTIDDWNEFGLNMKKFETLKKSEFLRYFSITNSLVNRVYSSRLNGRKAWKKRNFMLPFKNAEVLKAFGILNKNNVNVGASNTIDDINKFSSKISELDEIMSNCIKKAAKDFSYAPFDIYFDCAKKKKALLVKANMFDNKKLNRDVLFKKFAKDVQDLQKNEVI